MLSRVILCIAGAFALLVGGISDVLAADQAASFEALIRTATDVTTRATPVYLNKTRNQWAKRRFAISEVKYDVKKTDSLVTPIVGYAVFLLTATQSSFAPTKEQAEAMETFDPTVQSTYRIRLNYAFRNDRWEFKDGEYETSRITLPLTSEKLSAEPNAIPHAAVLLWIPQ